MGLVILVVWSIGLMLQANFTARRWVASTSSSASSGVLGRDSQEALKLYTQVKVLPVNSNVCSTFDFGGAGEKILFHEVQSRVCFSHDVVDISVFHYSDLPKLTPRYLSLATFGLVVPLMEKFVFVDFFTW